jgi:prephenate dehydrogenase
MKVKHITIIGMGLIGGSLGLAIKQTFGREIAIAAMDKERQVVQDAINRGAADEAIDEMRWLARTDLIFLCVPVLQMAAQAKKIAAYLTPGTIITDVGSTKGVIGKEVRKVLPDKIEYVAGHPIAGREQSGIWAADPNLFRDKQYILLPDSSTSLQAVQTVRDIIEGIGAKIAFMGADAHDACAALISHVPHVTAAALVNLLEFTVRLDELEKLAGGGFRDTTRIASSNADMWADICMTNREAISQSLLQLQSVLAAVTAMMEQKDREGLHAFFSKAKQAREKLLTTFLDHSD